MNYSAPDGNMENDPRSILELLSPENQKKSTGDNQELIELQWRNGHVVKHSQSHRKSPPSFNEFKQAHSPEPALKCGVAFENPSNSIQADETASWFQCLLDYTLDRACCSELFYEMPMTYADDTDKLNKNVVDDTNVLSQPSSKQPTLCLEESMMPPPKTHVVSSNSGGFVNFSHFSRPVMAELVPPRGAIVKRVSDSRQKEVGESSSTMTIGSSVCGSNQVQIRVDQSHTLSNDATGVLERGSKEDVQKRYVDTYETTLSSSSGASGSSFGRTEQKSGSHPSYKRKGRDGEESKCHSQEGDYESVKINRPAHQRSASARRSRAAEVHNLSERRRRDRINEKMRALQQLIPHCNKTDKASMLDEAIEYLKSLQLQVQLMWMGSGMTSMMFPSVQHYMSHMGMGVSHATMPSTHGHVPFQRVPLVNQPMPSAPSMNQTSICHSLTFNPLNFPNQMQNISLQEYARFLSFHHMQPHSQATNLYTYGSHTVPQSRTPMPSTSSLPTELGGSSGNIQTGRSG